MFIGNWDIDVNYSRGNIVYIDDLDKYYMCIENHKSNNLSFPSEEDVYWMYICNNFINKLSGKNNDHGVSCKDDYVLSYNNENYLCKSNTSLKRKLPNVFIDTFEDAIAKKYKKVSVNSLKRKLDSIEIDLEEHKRKRLMNDNVDTLRESLLLMDIDIDTKVFIMDKYDSTKKMSNSDYSKAINWLKTINKIPFGKYKDMCVKKSDSSEIIKTFFESIKSKLDENIHGLDEVKQEILEFVAKKITNPDSKGHVLALYGNAGVGKSKIIKTLAEALNFPLYQINCGGLNDVAVLTGHSETYIGAKPGKIVEVFTSCNYMNPIIYLDELDKVSENKATEIFGVLTHMLDEEQNNKFQDNYLSNVTIDLSKVFFVLAFNDISKIDSIVSDRLKIIYIDPPCLEDKIIICQDKMIPDILKSIKLKDDINVMFSKEIIEYIIVKKTQNESGVRQLRKNIEKILNRLNYDLLIGTLNDVKIEKIHYTNDKLNENYKDKYEEALIITKCYIDKLLKNGNNDNDNYSHMYI